MSVKLDIELSRAELDCVLFALRSDYETLLEMDWDILDREIVGRLIGRLEKL